MRIIITVIILVGGALFFRHWSLVQFNNAFDNLSASYATAVLTVSPSFKKDFEFASTSPEVASTTLPEIVTTVAMSTDDAELSLIFPQKGNRLYVGCTYQISWQSSSTISLLETALIDAGTREIIGPIASGLAKENSIEKDSQTFDWKVGSVWPGEYYIKISKINGIENETRSNVFLINKMPDGLSAEEKEGICKKNGS